MHRETFFQLNVFLLAFSCLNHFDQRRKLHECMLEFYVYLKKLVHVPANPISSHQPPHNLSTYSSFAFPHQLFSTQVNFNVERVYIVNIICEQTHQAIVKKISQTISGKRNMKIFLQTLHIHIYCKIWVDFLSVEFSLDIPENYNIPLIKRCNIIVDFEDLIPA